MGNRGARRNQPAYNDPYLSQYGTGYGYPSEPGLAGYGPPGAYGPYNTMITPPTLIEQPWEDVQWTEVYVPTVGGRARRPVIYVAVPWPGGSPFGGGMPMGGGFGGFGGGMPMGGGFGGFGGGMPMGGGLGGFGGGMPFGGGLGGNNQVLPMVTAQYLGGIPGIGGGYGGLGGGLGGGYGGLGGGLPLY